ncbi:hypothetical protein [Citrobacter freundii]|uniref:hypothetical protein n=1 Tax=Citrobacter freundii TaxID=546 RepID=UPI00190018C9|nr:hypothetical protein [Citrobacter freundii]MBJ9180035.1 hypothetical protein [Citrobacter freundii]
MYDSSAIQVLKGLEAVRKRPGYYFIEDVLDEAIDRALYSFGTEYVTVTKKEKAFIYPRPLVVKMADLDVFSEKKILCHSAVIGQESPLTITELLKASRRLARCPPTF